MSPLILFAMLMMTPVGSDHTDDDTALALALDAARDDPAVPFDLDVDCTDDSGRRSVKVIHGRVTVWNEEVQVLLDESERAELLDLLADAEFASFDARYGEVTRADKQEAPLRVSCRVHVAVDGLEKTSVQLFDGEQSKQLLRLAGALLDVVEANANDGETAQGIEDGLAKIATGQLEPEVLNMRWLALPDAGSSEPGFIVRITRAQIETQTYTPGKGIGETTSRPLKASQLETLIWSFEQAEFWELPVNVRADGLNEIELTILGQAKTVVARPTFRDAPADQQEAFGTLLLNLADIIAQ